MVFFRVPSKLTLQLKEWCMWEQKLKEHAKKRVLAVEPMDRRFHEMKIVRLKKLLYMDK